MSFIEQWNSSEKSSFWGIDISKLSDYVKKFLGYENIQGQEIIDRLTNGQNIHKYLENNFYYWWINLDKESLDLLVNSLAIIYFDNRIIEGPFNTAPASWFLVWNKYIVTNQHVTDTVEWLQILLYNGTYVKAKRIVVSDKKDLSIIEIEPLAYSWLELWWDISQNWWEMFFIGNGINLNPHIGPYQKRSIKINKWTQVPSLMGWTAKLYNGDGDSWSALFGMDWTVCGILYAWGSTYASREKIIEKGAISSVTYSVHMHYEGVSDLKEFMQKNAIVIEGGDSLKFESQSESLASVVELFKQNYDVNIRIDTQSFTDVKKAFDRIKEYLKQMNPEKIRSHRRIKFWKFAKEDSKFIDGDVLFVNIKE